MAGRAFNPRFVFTWPNHRIAVMGPKQLGGVHGDRRPAEGREAPASRGRRGVRADAPRPRGPGRGAVDGAVRHRAGLGRRDHRPPRHARRCSGWRCRRSTTTRCGGRRTSASSGCEGGDVRRRRSRESPGTCRSALGRQMTTRQARRIRRILVANRGEIASRVMRTARAMGIETVAVHSDPDAEAPFVREATCSVSRWAGGPAPSPTSTPAKILAAARRSGADAIHPGYGFLSENPQFAQAVMDAGLIWIGPTPEQMRAMALKVEAKRLVAEAGVPLVPGAELAADASPRGHRGRGRSGRLPAAGQGVRRRRRQGHAPGSRPGGPAREVPRRGTRRPPRSVIRRSSWSATSSAAGTSRSRSSATSTATSCTCSSASARSSAATRRSSRSRPRRGDAETLRGDVRRGRGRGRGRSATTAPGRWSSSSPARARSRSSTSWR